MNIAIITDSNSGITQKQAMEAGVFILPMPFMINGEGYFEDINLNQEQFYEKLLEGADISTSQPSPESIMSLWDQVLKEYDAIVHIPMSSGLSGSCQTATVLSKEKEYEGRVFVVNNHRISVTQRQSVLDAKRMAEEGNTPQQIQEILDETGKESSIYIMVDTLKYLKKGGRITPAAAALGTLLKLKPVLTIQGEKLDAFAKARTVKQARAMMISAISRDLLERFHDPDAEQSTLHVAYTYNREQAEDFKAEIQGIFPHQEIIVAPLSLSISCHIGPGSLALACTRNVR